MARNKELGVIILRMMSLWIVRTMSRTENDVSGKTERTMSRTENDVSGNTERTMSRTENDVSGNSRWERCLELRAMSLGIRRTMSRTENDVSGKLLRERCLELRTMSQTDGGSSGRLFLQINRTGIIRENLTNFPFKNI
jgi:hypothetical protein